MLFDVHVLIAIKIHVVYLWKLSHEWIRISIHTQYTFGVLKSLIFFLSYFYHKLKSNTSEPIAWQPAQKCCSKCITRNLAHLQAHEVSEASESWTCSNTPTKIPTGNLCVSQQRKIIFSSIERKRKTFGISNFIVIFFSLSLFHSRFQKCKLKILNAIKIFWQMIRMKLRCKSLRKVKMDQRKLMDNANTITDMAKVYNTNISTLND